MLRRLAISGFMLLSATSGFASSNGAPGPPAPPSSLAVFVKQDPAAESALTRSVNVYFHHAKNFSIPGLNAAVTMDDTVCTVTVRQGALEVLGLSRGDTVIIYWTDTGQTNLMVHIVDEPAVSLPPSLAHGGQFGTNGFVRTFTTSDFSGSGKGLLIDNQFAWTSQFGPQHSLTVQGTTQHAMRRFGHAFNFTTFSADWKTPGYEARMGDFGVVLRPQTLGRVAFQFPTPVLSLRGLDVLFHHGKDAYEVFGGTGIPSFFLGYGGVSRALGVNYQHELSEKLTVLVNGLYSAAAPLAFSAAAVPRQNDFTVLPVLSYRYNPRITMEAGAGFSSHGLRITSEAGYRGDRYDLFGAFSRMDSRFPFQLLRAGATAGENLALGGSYHFSRDLSLSASYQRQFAIFDRSQDLRIGGSNNLAVSGQYAFSRSQVFSGSYSSGGQANPQMVLHLRHMNAGLTSQFGSLSNSFQFSMVQSSATLKDMASHKDVSFFDGVRYSFGQGIQLTGGMSYSRTNFPLIVRIQQQLALLDPQLQQLFCQGSGRVPELKSAATADP